MQIRLLTQKSEMAPLYPLIRQLSPKVTEERYLFLLDDMLAHGYRMAAVYDNEGNCMGLSGIWTGTKIYSGKYLEMDNVVVAEAHRNKGIGQLLADYIVELGLSEGVEMMMLDAYKENHKAHAFYERMGFVRRGYHFLQAIGGWALQHPPKLPPGYEA
jgi:GNAT superfamily N-acetyltransferase